ncbi:MAG: hypothetical protein A2033_16185 [Bacteroidetes bacterium GWA2_31_9]|nr:MAG: hypothetical protein A2033_16185 [Bacteroidetes bacterium GWA2_31_9]
MKISFLIFLLFIISANSFSQKKIKLTENELNEFNSMFFDANKQKMLGNFDLAEKLLKKCIDIYPLSADSYYELANIYFYSDKLDLAFISAKKAVDINEENYWYRLFLANLYQKKGEFAKAADEVKTIIKQTPDDIDLYKDLSLLYSAAGDSKNAINVLNQLEKKIGINEDASLEKERIYINRGEYEKALNELQKLNEAFPSEPRYLGLLAELYMGLKQFDKAEQIFSKINEIDPANGINHLSMADFYRMKGDNDKSYEELKLAFQSTDVSVDLKVQMLVSFFSVSSVTTELNTQAYTLLHLLLQTHSEDVKAHTIYADYLNRDKRYSEARDEFRFVLKTEKSKYMIWEQLLYIDLEMRDFTSLYNECTEVIELFPTQPLPYLFKGIATNEMKKYQETIDIISPAIDLTDEKSIKTQMFTYIAEAYNKLKNNQKSDEYNDKILELDSNNVMVLNNYSYYLSVRGENLDKAEKMGKKAIELDPENYTYLDTYAWALFKNNKLTEAKEIIEKAMLLGGDKNAVIIEHYGDILFKSGDANNAILQWEKALEKGKGSELLEQKLKEKKLIE